MHRAEKEKSKLLSPVALPPSGGQCLPRESPYGKSPMANRLYLAPQSTVRQPECCTTEGKKPASHHPHSGAPRRRRYRHGKRTRQHRRDCDAKSSSLSSNIIDYNECHSESSNDSYECTLEAPLLWLDDDEEACGSLASRERKTGQRQRRHHYRRSLHESMSAHDFGNNDEESIYTYYSNQSSRKINRERKSSLSTFKKVCGRFLLKGDIFCSFRTRYRPIFQFLLFSCLIFLVWDARVKLSDHKAQLRHLEEEREHILHQMTWIDSEAKKAHEHYSSPKLVVTGHEHMASKASKQLGSRELDRIQLRIQQNARDFITERFGDGAMVVSLPLPSYSSYEGDVKSQLLSIALSGDAPHAVSTFTQQIQAESSAWSDLLVRRLVSNSECSIVSIEARSPDTNILPVLEFIEKTRGCHEAGSVSLHPIESTNEESQRLMLKIRLTASSSRNNAGDICIGRVVEGLDELDAMLPTLPMSHVDELPVAL